MSKGARNRRIRLTANENVHRYVPGRGVKTVKSLARRIRRVGWFRVAG